MSRLLQVFASLLLFAPLTFAAEIQVKVLDSQGAVVAGARVTAYVRNSTSAVAVAETRGDGVALLNGLGDDHYRLRVLAPGFAPYEADVKASSAEPITVRLAVASAAETVVVSAERTPLPTDESGAETALLDSRFVLES